MVLRPVLVRNLAFAAGLGAVAVTVAGGDGAGIATQVAGRPLGDASADAVDAIDVAIEARPTAMIGDVSLAGELDLSRMERVGDRYEVPLADGRRAILTLDPAIQAAAEKVLARSRAPRGAVVIADLDGRILAYAGRRTEDPAGGKDGISDPSLVNTVWAPAASVFKIATAAALVDAGVDPDAEVCYHGGLRSVMASNLEDHRSDNRCADLGHGLAHSQNAIIAKLVHRHLEPAQLRAAGAALGFFDPGADGRGGELPAWSLGGHSGTVDVPEDKGVDFAKTAAGFRGSELSPLAGALLAGTIAKGGVRPTPTIVARIVDVDGAAIEVTPPTGPRVLDAEVARAVGDMMVKTCDSGSAAKAFRGKDGLPRAVKVAGKTGTLSRQQPLPLEYSWFVGYAPATQPAFAVSVVLGNTDLWWLKGHTAARVMVAETIAALSHAP
jgi:penicillin-binding protein A